MNYHPLQKLAIGNKISGFSSVAIFSIITTVIIIALLAFDWYVITPQLKTNIKDVNTVKAEIKDIEDKLKKLNESRLVINEVLPAIKSLDLSVPSKEEIPELVLIVNSIASVSGINEINQINPGTSATTTTEGFQSLNLNINVTAYYENIILFLDNLYNSVRPIEIRSISLIPEAEEGSQGFITLNLDALTYIRSNSATTEGGASVDPNASQPTEATATPTQTAPATN